MTDNDWGYDVFRSRVRVTGLLTLCAGMRIGASRDLGIGISDLPIVKTLNGDPYIPGSSLKGVLRAGVEAWLRGLFADCLDAGTAYACNPIGGKESCIPNKDKFLQDNLPGGNFNSAEADALLWQKSCWVCRLFGSNWIASKAQIRDLDVTEDWRSEYLMVRDGVAIDRESETAANGFKYDFEALPAGTQFHLEILVENPQPHEMGLLLAAIGLLDQGFMLMGGAKSRGLGRVRLNITDIEELTPQSFLAKFPLPEPDSDDSKGGEADSRSLEQTPLGTEPASAALDAGAQAMETQVAEGAPETIAVAVQEPADENAINESAQEATDPMLALLSCIGALVKSGVRADTNTISQTMRDKGWPKEKLQAAFPTQRQFNYTKLCEMAVKDRRLISLGTGAFTLPGHEAPPALPVQPAATLAAAESTSASAVPEAATSAASETPGQQKLMEQQTRWKGSLRRKIQQEFDNRHEQENIRQKQQEQGLQPGTTPAVNG